MKIEYCLLSCDDNPLYLDFWPVVSKVWKLRFNITPILVYIGETNRNILSDYGNVIYQQKIQYIPINIQSLWARYYYTSHFSKNVCIISDIDMIPISNKYFIDQFIPFKNDDYIHLDTNENRSMLSSCYHVANGNTFSNHLMLGNTFESSMIDLINWGYSIYENNNSYWYVDELYATHKLKSKNIISLTRKSMDRLDRSDWNYKYDDIKNKYIDCHCLRPYKDNKVEIDELVDKILSI